MMRIGAGQSGFELKVQLTAALKAAGYGVAGFGAHKVGGDHYPDFVVPLVRPVARGEVTHRNAVCGSPRRAFTERMQMKIYSTNFRKLLWKHDHDR